jgi:transcriptional regulator with XRE-family HTH domain
MTIGERVRSLRKTLNLSGEKFGERIGVGKAAVSKMEIGDTVITEQTIKLVVSEFSVNERWLRTGEGTMLSEDQAARKKRLDARLNEDGDPFLREVIYRLADLPPEQVKAARDFIFSVVDECRKSAPPAPIDIADIAPATDSAGNKKRLSV